MKIWFIKDDRGLFHPLADSDYDKAKKIRVGEDTLFDTKKVRHPKHHRKYFALIKIAFDNQDEFGNIEVFRKFIEMESGYYLTEKRRNGDVIKIPASISFETLDQHEFSEVYERVLDKLVEIFSFEREDLINELIRFF